MRLIAFSFALLLAVALPAAAQRAPKDQLQLDPQMGEPANPEDAPQFMERPLPFRDGQILRYYDRDGTYEGYAVRRLLTIRFYDADGGYLGRAQRVSQAATVYYDSHGNYLGRRLHRKLVTTATATTRDNFNAGGFE